MPAYAKPQRVKTIASGFGGETRQISDREALGSNPEASTKIYIRDPRFGPPFSTRVTSLSNLRARSVD